MLNFGFPPFTKATALAQGVKTIWERSATRAFLITALTFLEMSLVGLPPDFKTISWEECKRGIISAAFTAVTALFFGDDSSKPPLVPPQP